MQRSSSSLALLLLTAGAAGLLACGKSYVDVPIPWQGTMASALASARAQNKPVFVFFGAEWDAAAKEIERVTLVDPEVRVLLAGHFVSIHIDSTDDEDPRTRELQERFKVQGDPTIIVVAADGTSELLRYSEFIPPPVLARALKAATTEHAVGEAPFEVAIYRRAQEARRAERRRRTSSLRRSLP